MPLIRAAGVLNAEEWTAPDLRFLLRRWRAERRRARRRVGGNLPGMVTHELEPLAPIYATYAKYEM
jgi:hypothetical protein